MYINLSGFSSIIEDRKILSYIDWGCRMLLEKSFVVQSIVKVGACLWFHVDGAYQKEIRNNCRVVLVEIILRFYKRYEIQGVVVC